MHRFILHYFSIGRINEVVQYSLRVGTTIGFVLRARSLQYIATAA